MPNFHGLPQQSQFLNLGIFGSAPAYDRVSSIPAWLPPIGTSELEDQYRGTNAAFDTSQFDQAAEQQRNRILGTALNSGNAAAADYANRARQAGGSGLGAGLVKAQAQVGAQRSAGDIELQRQKFDADQRSAAAAHASEIASSLGTLRSQYLNSIVNYSTSEDKINADYATNMAGLLARRGAGGGFRGPSGVTIGNYPGLNALGSGGQSFNNLADYYSFTNRMSQQNPHAWGG